MAGALDVARVFLIEALDLSGQFATGEDSGKHLIDQHHSIALMASHRRQGSSSFVPFIGVVGWQTVFVNGPTQGDFLPLFTGQDEFSGRYDT